MLVLPIAAAARETTPEALSAFPGAVGQGAAAAGGRGGDVYHVTNLRDYNIRRRENEIPGSLRHAIRSATGPRTIVFDVAGPLPLAAPLSIRKSRLTIAGQTSPGGVTLWGYPVNVADCSDVVIRYLRIRTGDFHARSATTRGATDTKDLDPSSANAVSVEHGCDRVILDHLSTSWGMDETLSVTTSRNVTVQHSIIAESLNHSFHPKGDHGYGSLIRGELTPQDQEALVGGYTFYGNLWAHHYARNPSIGGQQRLAANQSERGRRRTDVNLVNNVIYDWGGQPTHRSQLGAVRVNLIGNYYVNGPAKASRYLFHEGEAGKTYLFQQGNRHDADQDAAHDGALVDMPDELAREFNRFDESDRLLGPPAAIPFGFLNIAAEDMLSAEEAYERVVRSAGASLWRDAVDRRIIESLVHRTGRLTNSQEEYRDPQGMLPGIDDLPTASRPADFDSDGDGMSDEFETRRGLHPSDPADRDGNDLSAAGHTNLEVYLNELCASP